MIGSGARKSSTCRVLGARSSVPEEIWIGLGPGVGFFLPEIQRLRAECLLRHDPSQFDEAIREFEAAIATAKQQQARVFWLSAAIGLSRAWAAKGAPEEGIAQLQEVVCAFSGDDGPRELAIARQILSDHSH
jgi:hypothetical protein